jgi:hypothetical protein
MLFKNSIIIWICLELFLISITISYEIDNTINQSFSESQLKV